MTWQGDIGSGSTGLAFSPANPGRLPAALLAHVVMVPRLSSPVSTVRNLVFWLHLAAGLVAGLSIGVMCLTGTALAFEKELVAWSERGARRVAPPAVDAPRLSLEQMQARLRETQPAARPLAIVLQNDPRAAVGFGTGRTGGFYVNPYTGEVRQPQSVAMGEFMRTMTDWHRTLGFTGGATRPRGKLINGVCNLAFCVLAITGLYLWIPRQWSWRALRPVVWFRQNSSGKARYFNWHNVIGLWSAPILIVLTLTAIPISFQWGIRLINTLTGTPAPVAPHGAGSGGPGSVGGPAVELPAPPPGAKLLSPDSLLAVVLRQTPNWKTITLRSGGAGDGRGEAGPGQDRGRGGDATEARPTSAASAPPPITFTIRTDNTWPRTATTTLVLNPHTGDVLRRTTYANQPAPQRVRSWTRFLHTGEALGWGGQLAAGVACLGGCFLVYTGIALAWRRFFGKSSATEEG